MKTCRECNLCDEESLFCKKQNICLVCYSENKKQYYLNNKENIQDKSKQYRLDNKEATIKINKQYQLDHKDSLREYNKQYRSENKEKRNWQEKLKRKTDSSFKLRGYISSSICILLKSIGLNKNGKSCMKIVPFASIDVLWNHLESLFVHQDNLTSDGNIWMTKENQGRYNPKTWNDNDPNTWKWQLDHIIPQSMFDFSNPEEIKKCWALSNLRPLLAKQNILDGVKRIRHKK